MRVRIQIQMKKEFSFFLDKYLNQLKFETDFQFIDFIRSLNILIQI